MKVIDISVPIRTDGVNYPGNTSVQLTKQFDVSRGDSCNVTDISMSTHTSTHVDAPKHHHDEQPGIEGIRMEGLIGNAYVVDLFRAGESIKREDLQFLENIEPFDILLLKTRNSYNEKAWTEFDTDHAYITPEAADWIVDKNIKGVGIDCLSVERFGSDTVPTHKILLRNNSVVVIEGLDLRGIMPGYYFCACLPINIPGSDGAPARAVLIPAENLSSAQIPIGVRRDGSYYTRIEWASHTTQNPLYWVCNLIDDDTERHGGVWGANTNGPANTILSFFGETQSIGMLRIFHNVGAPISIIEELAREIKFYISSDDRCARFGDEMADIDSVEWKHIATVHPRMREEWTDIVLEKPEVAKYLRIELVENFGTPPHLPWVETAELKIFPPKGK